MITKIITLLFLVVLSVRPFISSIAFPRLDAFYSWALFPLSLFLLLKGLSAHRQPCGNTPTPLKPLTASPLPAQNNENNFLLIKKILFFITFYWLTLVLSTITSSDISQSLSQIYKQATCLILFLTIYFFNPWQKKAFVLTLLICGSAVALCAIYWLIGGPQKLLLEQIDLPGVHLGFAYQYLLRGRAFVPFFSPSVLAGFLILITPLSFAKLLGNKSIPTVIGEEVKVKNIFYIFSAILTSIALIATQSIGALGALIMAVLFSILVFNKGFTKKRDALLLTAVLIFAGWLIILLSRNKDAELTNSVLFSLLNRWSYWMRAIVHITRHPFLGLGPGNYPFFKSAFPHNTYLQIWAETGLFSFIAIASFLLTLFKRSAISLTRPQQDPAFYGLWIGSTAFLIHNIIDFTFFLPEVSFFWWSIAALLIGPSIRQVPLTQKK